MNWFRRLFGDNEENKTFEKDLELLIARWTNRARKDGNAMTMRQVGLALLDKAEAILDKPSEA